MSAAAPSTASKRGPNPSSNIPPSVNAMPVASEYGCGRRSVYAPMTGCSSDAVIWLTSVMSPICLKLRPNVNFSIG